MGFSAFLAMSFTPSLCATILRPREAVEKKKNVAFRWFDKGFAWVGKTYIGHIGAATRHAPRWMLIFTFDSDMP